MVAFKISAALLALTACAAPTLTSGALSVPSTSAKESVSLRIAAVAQVASQISNGPRSLRIAGVDYRSTTKQTRQDPGATCVTPSELKKTPLSFSNAQLRSLCGGGKHAAAKEFQAKHALFVEDFSTVAQWNDAKRPVNGRVDARQDGSGVGQRRLPPDAALSGDPRGHSAVASGDDPHHGGRSPSAGAAVSDFGLELQATSLLLSTSTAVDETFGWGAFGATQFLHAATTSGVSMKTKAFHSDIHARGLHHIKTHKYAVYGSLYWTAINDFVGKFLDVYYESNAVVQADGELQNWAKASAKIHHVKDWPSSFTTKDQLRDLLTELIFQSTVKHNVSSGEATWQSAVPPYSAAALWKPLPTAKLQANESLNLIQYTVPITVLPTALIASALFIRPVPTGQNLFNAYTVEPFVSEPALQPAIEAFTPALVDIETAIRKGEAGEKWPYSVMLPAHLPCFTWI